MSEFYVYELINPETSQPFYVGKGKGERINAHTSMNGIRAVRVAIEELEMKGLKHRVKTVKSNLSEDGALVLEAALIRKYGRRGKEPGGILVNTQSSSGKTGRRMINGDYVETIPTTTVQVKQYVVKQVRELITERGNLSLLTERLLNAWLSGSIDVAVPFDTTGIRKERT